MMCVHSKVKKKEVGSKTGTRSDHECVSTMLLVRQGQRVCSRSLSFDRRIGSRSQSLNVSLQRRNSERISTRIHNSQSLLRCIYTVEMARFSKFRGVLIHSLTSMKVTRRGRGWPAKHQCLRR